MADNSEKTSSQGEWRCSLPRDSHIDFLNNREWDRIDAFWKAILSGSYPLPDFLRGDETFGVTDLKPIHDLGADEFHSNDPRYHRRTFACRIGYQGSAYHGFQRQHRSGVVATFSTVEDDIQRALGKNIVAAGRTDREVSAVSQIVSFSSHDEVVADDLLLLLRNSPACREGKLAVWQCERVPRRFHALFSATWRRYIYLFPLKPAPSASNSAAFDIDQTFLQRLFSKLEGQELNYDGFAHREVEGGDNCTLYRARTSVYLLESSTSTCPSSSTCSSLDHPLPVVCIELVGSRFLRRMVRILAATALREATLPIEDRDEDLLLKIAQTRQRARASLAAPGIGLALAGVGYDLVDLAQHKHRPAGSADHDKKCVEIQECVAGAKRSCSLSISQSDGRRQRRGHLPASSSAPSKVFEAAASLLSQPFDVAWLPPQAEHELVAWDSLLLYYPQRAFSFSPPVHEVVLSQNCLSVATTLWDAEVVLSHFVHLLFLRCRERGETPRTVCELGAGRALASLVAARHLRHDAQLECKMANQREGVEEVKSCRRNRKRLVCVQELEQDVVDEALGIVAAAPSLDPLSPPSGDESGRGVEVIGLSPPSGYESGKGVKVVGVAGRWGRELVHRVRSLCRLGGMDLLLLADLLYHPEHFADLLHVVHSLSLPHTIVCVAFEQRRKDLSPVIQELAGSYSHHLEGNVEIGQQSEEMSEEEPRKTIFRLHVFSGKIEGGRQQKVE